MKHKKLEHIKSAGFKTPHNYFESFDAKLKKRLSENKPLDNIETSGFKVPDQYFQTLDTKISSQLKHDKPVIALKSKQVLYYSIAVAASIVLLFSIVFSSETVTNTPTFETLEMASIENYLYTEDYTHLELASLLTEDELSQDNFISLDISENTIETYLLDNINIEDLIE